MAQVCTFAAQVGSDYVSPMISPEAVLAMSLIVRDAGGIHPLKPIDHDGAVAIATQCSTKEEDEQVSCVAFWIAHGFRESGLQLHARGDCLDHFWDSADETYRKTHPKYYQPDAHGQCRPGDGNPISFGPFQTRTQPKTWAIAVESFARTLKRAEEVCAHDDKDPTCTPIEVVASGHTRSKEGKRIAAARYAEAARIEREYLFRDDPRAAHRASVSSFTMTTSLSVNDAPQLVQR
jgi:hypothetical protein